MPKNTDGEARTEIAKRLLVMLVDVFHCKLSWIADQVKGTAGNLSHVKNDGYPISEERVQELLALCRSLARRNLRLFATACALDADVSERDLEARVGEALHMALAGRDVHPDLPGDAATVHVGDSERVYVTVISKNVEGPMKYRALAHEFEDKARHYRWLGGDDPKPSRPERYA